MRASPRPWPLGLLFPTVGLLLLGFTAGAPLPAGASDEPGPGWLGVGLQELTPELREALNLDRRVKGILVSSVVPDSPAQKAGILEEDVITEIDNKRVETADQAIEIVRGTAPGTEVLVTLNRNGRTRALGVVLGSRSDMRLRMDSKRKVNDEVRHHYLRRHHAPDRHVWIYKGEDRGFLGVRTLELEEQLATYFEVPSGVLVTKVVENSPAQAAGLVAGDVIVAVGDTEVEDPEDLRRVVRKHDPEDEVDLSIVRKGSSMVLPVTLGNVKDFSGLHGVPRGLRLKDLGDLDLHLELHELPNLIELHELPNLIELYELPEMEIHLEGLDEHDWEEIHEDLRESLEDIREDVNRIRLEIKDGIRNHILDRRVLAHEEAQWSYREARERVREELEQAREAARRACDLSRVEKTI